MRHSLKSARLPLVFLTLCVALAAPSLAGTIVLYPFSADLNPTVIGPGVTPTLTVSTLGLAIISEDGFGNVLEAYPTAGSTSAALALTNQSYFTLLLSITPGTLGPLSVSFEVAKGGFSDPRGYFVRSSLDGFTTDVFSEILPAGANQAPAPRNFQLNATGLTSASMRFYLFTPDPTNNSVDFRNLQVDAVPEPSTWAIAIIGVTFLLTASRFRSRRD